MVTAGVRYWTLLLTTFPYKCRSLRCLHGSSESSVSVEVTDNSCTYYEVNSCSDPRMFLDSLTVENPSGFSEACGVFKNSSFENIAACFCSDDDCNGEQTKTFIDNSIRLPTPLPDTTSWTFVPISNKTKEVLQCFRKNMYPPGASPVKESKVDESSNLMEWIAICVAVVMVLCCIAPVAYYYVAETRRARQRKAQEAAKQSKTSGSISSPAASQATQLSKTSKASFTSPAASLSSSMKKSMSEPAPKKKDG